MCGPRDGNKSEIKISRNICVRSQRKRLRATRRSPIWFRTIQKKRGFLFSPRIRRVTTDWYKIKKSNNDVRTPVWWVDVSMNRDFHRTFRSRTEPDLAQVPLQAPTWFAASPTCVPISPTMKKGLTNLNHWHMENKTLRKNAHNFRVEVEASSCEFCTFVCTLTPNGLFSLKKWRVPEPSR